MHPALWTLMRLYRRSSWRRLFRGARTVRGAVLLAFLVGGSGLVVAGSVFMTFLMRGAVGGGAVSLDELRQAMPWNPIVQPGMIGTYLPLVLLAMFLKAILGKGGWRLLYFTPPEVEFLFAGPFHRRELLLFKLWRMGLGTVLGSLLLVSTPLGLFCRNWWAGFVGLTLTLAFLSLCSLASTLTRLLLAEAAQTRARRAVLIAVGTLAAVALPRTVSGARVLHHASLVASFRSTWPGRILLGPFEVFSHLMLAERWFPDLVGWAAAGLAIDAALVLLVIRLDADYLEWSVAISEWVHDAIQNARRSGGLIARAAPRGRFRLPAFPWLGGAGPILWRQMLMTHRRTRGAIRMAVLLNVVILGWNWMATGRYPTAAITPAMVLAIFGYGTFMSGTTLPLAFRGDVNHLDALKALPARPIAVAAGELAGCVAVLSASQLAFLAIYGLATLSGGWLLPATILIAPAITYLLLATGNLLFLLYPVPTTPGAAAELSVVGRVLWTMLLQMLMTAPLLGFPAAMAGLVYLTSGHSAPATIATAMAVLAIEAIPMTMLAAWAFDRFDPSMDTPA